MAKRPSRLPLYISAAVFGIAVVAGLVFKKPHAYHGTLITPPLQVSDFNLQTTNGTTFRLSDAKGKVVALFFGYTSCPDVCPITLATFKQVHDRLGSDSQGVKFVMVTVDPGRDTPEKMGAYVKQFNPEFVGLSGSLPDLQPIWTELGVSVERQESNSAAGYLISHTASVYILDGDGNLVMMLPYGITAADMADDLKQLLKESNRR